MMLSHARRVLYLDPAHRRYALRRVQWQPTSADDPFDYTLLWGEALCQYVLRRTPDALVIARGPMPFISGNKTTVGYLSPMTGVPHYSFVGGQGFAALVDLGLDAIVLAPLTDADPEESRLPVIHVTGRAPDLHVAWLDPDGVPTGQRSAYYRLVEKVLDGHPERGSVFVTGDAARHGYRTANLAVEGLYHAGRGGAGHVFARYARALVLEGEPATLDDVLGARAEGLRALRRRELQPRLAKYCDRLSDPTGGTLTKLWETGRGEGPTLPAHNAERLGYEGAALGSETVLRRTRDGQTGCRWCQVNCRHWHWVPAAYAPEGRDRYLDDFEPTYSLFAMLDLQPDERSRRGLIALRDAVERRLVVPIEQLGADVIDLGVGMSALFTGIERGIVPASDLPPFLREGPTMGSLDAAARVVEALREGDPSPALRALADGAQALAERYPALQPHTFTSGPGTLANPGHANALWTFMMAFSRFFGHYSGQTYKVSGSLDELTDEADAEALFARVVREMVERESFICLGNALSNCGFTFVIFSEGGEGQRLAEDELLRRTLAAYGLEAQPGDLRWFARAFWAQSMAMKAAYGWRPPAASDLPASVYALLAQSLDRTPDALEARMAQLIDAWKAHAGQILRIHGHRVPW